MGYLILRCDHQGSLLLPLAPFPQHRSVTVATTMQFLVGLDTDVLWRPQIIGGKIEFSSGGYVASQGILNGQLSIHSGVFSAS
eukprot:1116163-Prorocentrum_minimum.AAC.1